MNNFGHYGLYKNIKEAAMDWWDQNKVIDMCICRDRDLKLERLIIRLLPDYLLRVGENGCLKNGSFRCNAMAIIEQHVWQWRSFSVTSYPTWVDHVSTAYDSVFSEQTRDVDQTLSQRLRRWPNVRSKSLCFLGCRCLRGQGMPLFS